MEALSRFATRHPWSVILLFLAITLALGSGLSRLRFDNSPESFVPPDLPAKRLLDEVRDTFGSADMAIAALKGEVWSVEGLEALRAATEAVAGVDGVLRVTSLANAQRMEEADGDLVIEDLLPEELTPAEIPGIRDYVEHHPLYAGRLVSPDGRYAAVILEVDPGQDMKRLNREILDALKAHWKGPIYLSGTPALSGYILDTMQRDLPVQMAVAALIIALVLYLNFRSTRGVLLPLLTVTTALVWSLGLGGWLGFKLGSISSILPVVVLAVGSSFTLHILNRFYHELAHGEDRPAAIRLAVRETGLGVLVSALAAGAGLAALYTSSIPQIKFFGVLAAFGVLVAFLGASLLAPAVLALLRNPRRLLDPERPDAISRLMFALGDWLKGRTRGILVAAAVFLLLMVFFATRIQVETSFLAYFPKSSPPRVATELIDRVFGGSDTLTVVVEGNLKDPALLRAIYRFEEEAKAQPAVGSAVSIADVIREIHKTLTGSYGFPDSEEAAAQELLLYQMSGDPEELARFITEDASAAQITVQVRSLPSSQMEALVHRLKDLAEATIAPHADAVKFTGTTVLMLEVMRLILHDQYVSLILALVLVALFNALLLVSGRVGAVSVLPLGLTIAGQFGLMGAFGIPLDTATALIAAIAIGVGDYSVHIIVRYLEELRKGAVPEAAARTSLYVSGRAVFFTALAIGGGFMALLFSGFAPIQTFAKLMGFTVGATALFALTVLPAALLTWVRRYRNKEVVERA